jgi:hypothetical protein
MCVAMHSSNYFTSCKLMLVFWYRIQSCPLVEPTRTMCTTTTKMLTGESSLAGRGGGNGVAVAPTGGVYSCRATSLLTSLQPSVCNWDSGHPNRKLSWGSEGKTSWTWLIWGTW